MKILLLCDEKSNQKALAHKIHKEFKLTGIVLYKLKKNVVEEKYFKLILNKAVKFLSCLATFGQFRKAWFGMLDYYSRDFPEFPIKPLLEVNDINNRNVEKIINNYQPELVLVSGTNILKEKLLDLIMQYGKIINLHTGISPYVKGAPDSTFWCLYLKEFDLIGNTIMWINKGIDSGNIIATEQTYLNGNENLLDLKIKVMNHGHYLYLRAIEMFYKKKLLPNVSQNSFKPKRLFLSKDWGIYQQVIALYNFNRYFKPNIIKETTHKLVSLSTKISNHFN